AYSDGAAATGGEEERREREERYDQAGEQPGLAEGDRAHGCLRSHVARITDSPRISPAARNASHGPYSRQAMNSRSPTRERSSAPISSYAASRSSGVRASKNAPPVISASSWRAGASTPVALGPVRPIV